MLLLSHFNKKTDKEDDIFKGSHSSNFFNGRNGKDDDYDEVKPERTSTVRTNVVRGRQRGRVNYRNGASVNQIAETKSTSPISSSPRGNQYNAQIASTTSLPGIQKQQLNNHNAVGRISGTTKQLSSSFGSPQTNTYQLQTTTPVNTAASVTPNSFKVTGQYHSAPAKVSQSNQFNVLDQNTNTDKSVNGLQQSTVRPVVLTNPEQPKITRQDPFKVTKNHQFINQQDQFNYQLNNAFQPTRAPTPTALTTTTELPVQKAASPIPFVQSNTQTNQQNNNNQFNNNQFNQQFNNNNGQLQQNPFNQNQNNQFKNNNNQFNNNNRQFNSNNNQQQFKANNQFNYVAPTTTITTTSTARPEVKPQNADSSFQRNSNQNAFQHTISGQYQIPKSSDVSPSDQSKDIFKTSTGQAEQNQRNSNDFRINQPYRNQFDVAKIAQTQLNNNQPRVQSPQNTNTNPEISRNSNINKESRTLLSSFSFEPSPTTYNPHSHQQQQRTNQKVTEAPFISSSPRGFSVTPPRQNTTAPANSRYQTLSRSSENYTPSTVKRFSTLVPRELYNPTTFKPSAYVKPAEVFSPRIEQQNKFVAPAYSATAAPITPTISTTTLLPSTTTTAIPLFGNNKPSDDDEDDGQYRPELYEQDFAKNKLKNKNKNVNYNPNFNSFNNKNNNNNQNHNNHQNTNQQFRQPSPPLPVQSSSSGEDEFLHTAHSQNIAASKNELHRAAAAAAVAQQQQKASKQHSQKSISKAPTIPPNATSTKRPVANDKDASYDYAYYDSVNDSPHDYSEYGITDFGRTTAKKN